MTGVPALTAGRSLVRTLGFAVLYLVATYAGRLTIMDGTNLSLVWPAAGVAAVWFVAQRSSRWRVFDVLALAAVTMVVNTATGAPAVLAALFFVANLAQAWMFSYLFGRWLPDLWGGGGTAPLSRPRHLWLLVAISGLATATGAVIGPTAVWLVTGSYSAPAAAVWMARNTASMLLIGAAGLCVGAGLRRRTGPRPITIESIVVTVVSAVAYLAVFGFLYGQPLAFVLIVMTVWAGSRLSTTFVVFHGLILGSVSVVCTLHGSGPFAAIASHPVRALVGQLFVGVVAVVGLAVALGRDERVAVQRAAADQARLLTTIIDSMSEGLAVVDAEGRFLLTNPASRRLIGTVSGTGQAAGNDFYGFHRTDGTLVPAGELPFQRALATGEPAGADIIVRNAGVPQGRTLAVRAVPLPYDIDGRRYAVNVFSDVTAQRRQVDELVAFAGVVAHDLSNPLTTVEGWAEIIAETVPAGTEAAGGIARISRAGARMRSLIEDLLSYTIARDSAPAPERVAAAELVAAIAADRADQAESSGTPGPDITCGELPDVEADPDLVRRLFDTVIGTAIRYAVPGRAPRIVIDGERDGDVVRIRVSDDGIGIPAGGHEAVFESFHRDPRVAGTGLGLAICRRIVHRHGGTITAAANPGGGGTTITLTLPAYARARSIEPRVPVDAEVTRTSL
ncbi:ATP-binding protein [Actinoplanes sp. NPDC051494]|uniref:ATP-binding protein n=1 Tax=Actinoplanes sp. NPDC051494 TaxID=3363907 RepID=UPI0037A718E9